MNNLIAFHGQLAIKRKYLIRVQAHRKADEIIHGTYWEKGKGCAVGCTVHSWRHSDYEDQLGIPRALARIEDGIFEGLANSESKLWPEKFLKTIKVGADLSGVIDCFLHWLLIDPTDGVIRFAKTDRAREAIQRVGDLYARKEKKESITNAEWKEAAAAAAVGAYAPVAAYYATSAAYDASATTSAADATYATYASASASAAAAAAASATATTTAAAASASASARIKARGRQAEKLLELLGACPGSKQAVKRTGRERAAKKKARKWRQGKPA